MRFAGRGPTSCSRRSRSTASALAPVSSRRSFDLRSFSGRRSRPARKEIREHSDYRAAVYGSVVVAALLGALYRSDASARAVAISVLSTTLVFWLAHLWASIVSEQIVIGQGFPWRRLPVLAAEEWPLVESGFIPLAPLVLAWIGVLSGDRGIHIALVFAIGQLVAWGIGGRAALARHLAGGDHLGLLHRSPRARPRRARDGAALAERARRVVVLQLRPVLAEPADVRAPVRARGVDEAPERRRVVRLAHMAELVDDDVGEHVGRRDDEPPRERERPAARAGGPAGALVADRKRAVCDPEPRRLALDCGADAPPRLAPVPPPDDACIVARHDEAPVPELGPRPAPVDPHDGDRDAVQPDDAAPVEAEQRTLALLGDARLDPPAARFEDPLDLRVPQPARDDELERPPRRGREPPRARTSATRARSPRPARHRSRRARPSTVARATDAPAILLAPRCGCNKLVGSRPRTAHSLYLRALAELGPVGLLLVVVALGPPLARLRTAAGPLRGRCGVCRVRRAHGRRLGLGAAGGDVRGAARRHGAARLDTPGAGLRPAPGRAGGAPLRGARARRRRSDPAGHGSVRAVRPLNRRLDGLRVDVHKEDCGSEQRTASPGSRPAIARRCPRGRRGGCARERRARRHDGSCGLVRVLRVLPRRVVRGGVLRVLPADEPPARLLGGRARQERNALAARTTSSGSSRLTGATDPDGDTVTLTVTGVTQDEPVNGVADGNTSPDAEPGPQSHTVYIRGERAANGDGRVYRIAFTAIDGKGGTCSGTVAVAVPHNKRSTPVDSSPPSFDSFGP